jgi:hypothetical protein
MADELRVLFDDRVLASARRANRRLDVAIYRWQMRRLQLFLQRPYPYDPNVIKVTAASNQAGTNVTDREAEVMAALLFGALTVSDVMELSDFEPITLQEWEEHARPLTGIAIPQIGYGLVHNRDDDLPRHVLVLAEPARVRTQ